MGAGGIDAMLITSGVVSRCLLYVCMYALWRLGFN